MGIGLLGGQVGLEALPGIQPWPSPHADRRPHASPNDGAPDSGTDADDPGTDAAVTTSPNAIDRKLLKLV